jgi:hypothetical protein
MSLTMNTFAPTRAVAELILVRSMSPLKKQRLISGTEIGLATLGAAAAVWFWALPVLLCFISYMHSPSHPPTDAQMIRDLWSFRLIQPEWLSRASDHTPDLLWRWQATETAIRASLVFLLWTLAMVWIRRHHRLLKYRET